MDFRDRFAAGPAREGRAHARRQQSALAILGEGLRAAAKERFAFSGAPQHLAKIMIAPAVAIEPPYPQAFEAAGKWEFRRAPRLQNARPPWVAAEQLIRALAHLRNDNTVIAR